jgi:hypothetical protein
VKKTAAIVALLLLAAGGGLLLPTGNSLELYDVQDITYSLNDFGGGVDISLAGSDTHEDPICVTGFELVERLTAIIPGLWGVDDDRTIQFQNGMIIVRATAAQHAVIRSYLALHRVAVNRFASMNASITRAKIRLWGRLFGMITK